MHDIKSVINMDYEDKYDIEELNGRRLYINGGIDECVIDTICFHIMRYNREDIGKPKNERTPIKLYINSNGGSVTDGFGLIDTILMSETPVYTINQATCYSMGFLIFLAGNKRFSMPHSTFLCHDGSSMAFDSMSKLKDRMEFETTQMEQHIKEYVISRTGMDENLYKEKYRVEWYMYPEEAKENGVVTDIVGKDCDINEIL